MIDLLFNYLIVHVIFALTSYGKMVGHFIFMLPCIVIDFFLNNQPDALIIQIFILLYNSTCSGHLLCPSSRVFYCTFGIGKFHAGW